MTSQSTMVSEGDVLWQAPLERIENSQLARFQRWLRERHGLVFDDYPSLWRWSVTELDAFWTAIWDHCEIISDGRFDSVRIGKEMFLTQWFVGSRVNYA